MLLSGARAPPSSHLPIFAPDSDALGSCTAGWPGGSADPAAQGLRAGVEREEQAWGEQEQGTIAIVSSRKQPQTKPRARAAQPHPCAAPRRHNRRTHTH